MTSHGPSCPCRHCEILRSGAGAEAGRVPVEGPGYAALTGQGVVHETWLPEYVPPLNADELVAVRAMLAWFADAMSGVDERDEPVG